MKKFEDLMSVKNEIENISATEAKEKLNDPNVQILEKSISDKIGLNVSIKNTKKNKGTITFVYHDIEQLNKIIDIIKSNY